MNTSRVDETAEIRKGVYSAYSRAAAEPRAEHPFPVGREFAESVGYPKDLLDQISSDAVDAFAGVSNISIVADLPKAARVLDVGCGAGLDSIVAARRTGIGGEVVGIDFSEAMVHRASHAAAATDAGAKLRFLRGVAESMPVETGWADVVLVNGIFNLNPARAEIFQELARVTRPGGTVFSAELILRGPLPPNVKSDPDNWFA